MKNKWFEEVFLASLVEKAKNNPEKYQHQVILSPKQADICYRYMNYSTGYCGTRSYTSYDYETNTHSFTLVESGRYCLLHISDKEVWRLQHQETLKSNLSEIKKDLAKAISKLENSENMSEEEKSMIREDIEDYNECIAEIERQLEAS